MAALNDLWNSEKGLLGLALIIAATVLAALGIFSSEQWESYTKWIFGFYVAGKTLQSAVTAISSKPADPASKTISSEIHVKEPVQ